MSLWRIPVRDDRQLVIHAIYKGFQNSTRRIWNSMALVSALFVYSNFEPGNSRETRPQPNDMTKGATVYLKAGAAGRAPLPPHGKYQANSSPGSTDKKANVRPKPRGPRTLSRSSSSMILSGQECWALRAPQGGAIRASFGWRWLP